MQLLNRNGNFKDRGMLQLKLSQEVHYIELRKKEPKLTTGPGL